MYALEVLQLEHRGEGGIKTHIKEFELVPRKLEIPGNFAWIRILDLHFGPDK
jgi:hypothetical protein